VTGIAQTVTDGQFTTGRYKFEYRKPDSRDWKELTPGYVDRDDFWPLAIDAQTDSLYASKKVDGRSVLVNIKLDGSLAEQQIAANPKVDIDEVLTVGEARRVIGYTYAEEKRNLVYTDPEYKALASSLSKALPNLPLVGFVAANDDSNKLLLFASSDRDPGHYYLFDTAKKTLSQVFPERPSLDGRKLADVRPITYKAADGTEIPAYLTLPPGKSVKGLPSVVMPHGGPSSRDEWGFDWIAQFLAERHRVFELRLREEHHELFAAVTREAVRRADRALEPPGHFGQHHVAGLMAEGVVDVLEAVDVDEGHRERPAVAVRVIEGVGERGAEVAAIEDAAKNNRFAYAPAIAIGALAAALGW